MLHDPHTAQWQPVETAPPDRQVCAARFENQTMTFAAVGVFNAERTEFSLPFDSDSDALGIFYLIPSDAEWPTHWLPLPACDAEAALFPADVVRTVTALVRHEQTLRQLRAADATVSGFDARQAIRDTWPDLPAEAVEKLWNRANGSLR